MLKLDSLETEANLCCIKETETKQKTVQVLIVLYLFKFYYALVFISLEPELNLLTTPGSAFCGREASCVLECSQTTSPPPATEELGFHREKGGCGHQCSAVPLIF
jgi:hypothetical protein